MFRSTGSVVVGTLVASLGLGAGLLGWLAGGPSALALTVPVLVAAVVGWLRPRVVVDGRGVVLRNVLVDVGVPWAALASASVRWSLELEDQRGRRHSSWALTGSARRRRKQLKAAREQAERQGSGALSAAEQTHTQQWASGWSHGMDPLSTAPLSNDAETVAAWVQALRVCHAEQFPHSSTDTDAAPPTQVRPAWITLVLVLAAVASLWLVR